VYLECCLFQWLFQEEEEEEEEEVVGRSADFCRLKL
jgi:hypothetical protein